MMNTGYLTCGRDAGSDCVYTPFYAVEPIVKYIPKHYTIWLPFDMEWSAFVQVFKANGYKVINSHIELGQDFFNYYPDEPFDCIVSNPPFSIKDKVLKRLYELGKPFAVLLPLNSLQGQSRYKCFKNGLQLLGFDKRIDYHRDENFSTFVQGCCFSSVYFCKDILPKDLILEELVKYQKPLIP